MLTVRMGIARVKDEDAKDVMLCRLYGKHQRLPDEYAAI